MKFLSRKKVSDYQADQSVTIPDGGGSDTVEQVPLQADDAIEVEMDDGSVYVLLAYKRK